MRRRSTTRGRGRWPTVAAATGVVVVVGAGLGVAASAAGGSDQRGQQGAAAGVGSVSCPSVEGRLPVVPEQARREVAENVALLQRQVDEANRRLVSSAGEGGPNFVRNAITGPLVDKRVATLNRIATAIGRNAPRPGTLVELAECSLVPAAP